MSTSITQVQNKLILRDAEFVRITMADTAQTHYTFSTSFRSHTFSTDQFPNQPYTEYSTSTVFSPMGGLVSISGHQRDLSVTSYDTSISLAGIDQTKLNLILNADKGLKGAKVEIWRGFYTDTYELDGAPVLRYTGIVTGYNLDENYSDMADTYQMTIHCSSFKRVLEVRLAGRFTNKSSWRSVSPNDAGMDNVAALNGAKYNFGQKLA
jgi:hypothetical protein